VGVTPADTKAMHNLQRVVFRKLANLLLLPEIARRKPMRKAKALIEAPKVDPFVNPIIHKKHRPLAPR
jgi:hypothetical protein